MNRRRRWFLGAGSRYPHLARRAFQKLSERFQADPERFLDRLVATWSAPDRAIFRRFAVFLLFLLADGAGQGTGEDGADGLEHRLIVISERLVGDAEENHGRQGLAETRYLREKGPPRHRKTP